MWYSSKVLREFFFSKFSMTLELRSTCIDLLEPNSIFHPGFNMKLNPNKIGRRFSKISLICSTFCVLFSFLLVLPGFIGLKCRTLLHDGGSGRFVLFGSGVRETGRAAAGAAGDAAAGPGRRQGGPAAQGLAAVAGATAVDAPATGGAAKTGDCRRRTGPAFFGKRLGKNEKSVGFLFLWGGGGVVGVGGDWFPLKVNPNLTNLA